MKGGLRGRVQQSDLLLIGLLSSEPHSMWALKYSKPRVEKQRSPLVSQECTVIGRYLSGEGQRDEPIIYHVLNCALGEKKVPKLHSICSVPIAGKRTGTLLWRGHR